MARNENIGLRQFFSSRYGVTLMGFLAVAGYFLWTEHRAHVSTIVPYLPFLLLLACPLLHIFMHRGHGGHGSHDRAPENEQRKGRFEKVRGGEK